MFFLVALTFFIRELPQVQPAHWTLVEKDPDLIVSGTPTAGVSEGAVLEFREEDETAGRGCLAEVIRDLGTHLVLRPISEKGTELPLGSRAFLVQPSLVALNLSLTPLEPGSRSGLSNDRFEALTNLFPLQKTADPFHPSRSFQLFVGTADDGRLAVFDERNEPLCTFSVSPDQELDALRQFHHARETLLRLSHLKGYGFHDQITITAAAVAPDQERGARIHGSENQFQFLGVGQTWQLRVSLHPKTAVPLLLTVICLSEDGQSESLPPFQGGIRLNPGETYIFPRKFQADLPIGQRRYFFIFGQTDHRPIHWQSLLHDQRNARSESVDLLDQLYPTGIKSIQGERAMWWTKTVLVVSTVADFERFKGAKVMN